MKAQAFGSPIFVKRAAYVVQEIADLEDAIDFLDEWPEDRRDLIHETAFKACFDAYDGNKPLSAARAAFCGFAKRAAILEDPTSAMQ
ncbi:DUF982 domain-containing protein [Mesorhizobium sp. VK25A]|nr:MULTISPECIES: DUF982 domain-containing protein [unclassified Mesorhizobium]MDX8535535.1 DUF982 domain-containing protein [Mesorhizobium sp. VK25D]MDX8548212.1 DUF982 domain-containing protein [Mesorhizobium sp. VK25A]